MNIPLSKSALATRLRASPSFVQALTLDGRPYIAKEVEPYIQYWLTERYRILLSIFSGHRGATVKEALEAYFRLTAKSSTEIEQKRLIKAIQDMKKAGVLIGSGDDVSRYNTKIVEDYLTHRPFPTKIAELIIESAPVNTKSRVLDLAGGPGDLALKLAQVSSQVSLMELSRGFLQAASKRAEKLGVNLTPLHESCNRLVHHDDEFDVITVAQALHWLDDVLVCRGVCRLLRPNGSFFVMHSIIDLDDQHPLSYVFGNDSILGKKVRQPFVDDVRPLLKRLTLLFEALDSPEVERVDVTQRPNVAGMSQKIIPVGVTFFRQRMPFGPGYARGFLTDQHIAVTGQTPSEFWRDLDARCSSATPQQLLGTLNWAVIHFRRGGERYDAGQLESCQVVEIGF